MLYFLLFSFVSKNLTNYGRRHLKLFTKCHVFVGHPVCYIKSLDKVCIGLRRIMGVGFKTCSTWEYRLYLSYIIFNLYPFIVFFI